jgi:hypothetical protein
MLAGVLSLEIWESRGTGNTFRKNLVGIGVCLELGMAKAVMCITKGTEIQQGSSSLHLIRDTGDVFVVLSEC